MVNSVKSDFVGETPDLGGVIWLLSKRIKKKIVCNRLLGKLKNYVFNHFKHAEDVVCVPTDLTDPTTNFESKFMPSDLTKEEEKKPRKKKMREVHVKKYLDRG